MPGLAPISLQQFHDSQGRPLAGARAFFTEADSLEPITIFKDYSLGQEHPNPVIADARGFFPAIFLDEEDGFYRLRVTTSAGSSVLGSDNPVLPIIGPGEGGGGAEVPVDPNALWQTADIKVRAGTGVHSGWVRCNGRTIGSATSGASERANADTSALYVHLWDNFIDAICPVTGGRGGSAAADYSANKPIGLIDLRGCTIGFLDDMANSASGRLTTDVFTTSGQGPTILGAFAGVQRHALVVSELPSHDHGGVTGSDGAHQHGVITQSWFSGSNGTAGTRPAGSTGAGSDATNANATASAGTHTHTVSAQGGGGAHNNVQPTRLFTAYLKL